MKQFISTTDLEALAIGSLILGSGGGGDPSADLLIAYHQIEKYGPAQLISLDELKTDDLIVSVGFIGAPSVHIEQLPSGNEIELILQAVQQQYGRKVTVIMAGEIGGSNAFAPLHVASRLQLPLLDADELGRAFPELQMVSANVHGLPFKEAFFADNQGNVTILHLGNNSNNAKKLELVGRHIAIACGSNAALGLHVFTADVAQQVVIPGSFSRALELGKIILDARKNHTDPLEALINKTDGIIMGHGIIEDIDQKIEHGFLQGSVTIDEHPLTSKIVLEYRNEYLIAQRDQTILATTPDIIMTLDSQTGEPIPCESLNYGMRVHVIGLPSPEIWRTKKGLELVGPSYFGYNYDYIPLEKTDKGTTMKTYVLGIDIGGTNTDIVLVDEQEKICVALKIITTDPVHLAVADGINQLIASAGINPQDITGVFVGTTHATNAILQRKDLFKVGLIRLCSDSTKSVPPYSMWPQDLIDNIYAGHALVDGGYRCDGIAIKDLNSDEVKSAVHSLLDQGAESMAIVGVYAPMKNDQELMVKNIIHEIAGEHFPVSLSHTIGGTRFIERENATILNAALRKSMQRGFSELSSTLASLNINCPFYIVQNNGTIMPVEHMINLPILSIAAGPTNSFVGASKLADLSNAIVADIGGTSTDFGIILNGFARRSIGVSTIGGIKLNFAMPDVISIPLGGGSYIEDAHDSSSTITIGPESAGNKLKQQSYCFGGDKLTLTDVAVYKEYASIKQAQKTLIPIDQSTADVIMEKVKETILAKKDLMGGKVRHLPLVLVGGGALLFKNSDLANTVIIPDYAHVANAYGAALALISGTVDTIISLENRDLVLQKLINQASEQALERGADKNTIALVDQTIVPFHYTPQAIARVIITVAGKRKYQTQEGIS